MDYIDEIYYTLQGQMIPEAAVPWVPNVFAEDKPCAQAYENMRAAYDRLLVRLGETDEDADVEAIIHHLTLIQDILCRDMFLCGVEFARRFYVK